MEEKDRKMIYEQKGLEGDSMEDEEIIQEEINNIKKPYKMPEKLETINSVRREEDEYIEYVLDIANNKIKVRDDSYHIYMDIPFENFRGLSRTISLMVSNIIPEMLKNNIIESPDKIDMRYYIKIKKEELFKKID